MTDNANNVNQSTGFGERLRAFRTERSLTQAELAIAAGLEEITIQKYESGERFGRRKSHEKLAEVFGVSVNELVYGRVPEKNQTPELSEINSLAIQLPRSYQVIARDFLKVLLRGYLQTKNIGNKILDPFDNFQKRKNS